MIKTLYKKEYSYCDEYGSEKMTYCVKLKIAMTRKGIKWGVAIPNLSMWDSNPFRLFADVVDWLETDGSISYSRIKDRCRQLNVWKLL